MANTVTDDAMAALTPPGSLRDMQMAAHVVAGRTTGSYVDRCVAGATIQFPK